MLKFVTSLLAIALVIFTIRKICQNRESVIAEHTDMVGKIILVTGASSGLGRELSIQLSSKNAIVYLVGRDLQNLLKTLSLMRPNDHKIFQIDLTNDKQIQELFEQIKNVQFDKVFLNAGVGFQNRQATLEDCKQVFQTNIIVNAFLAMNLKYNHLVLVSSPQALFPLPNRSLYASSKAALHQLGCCLRMDGARVTLCYPRWFESNLRGRSLGANVNKEKSSRASSSTSVAQKIVHDSILLKRKSCLTLADQAIQICWIFSNVIIEKLVSKFTK